MKPLPRSGAASVVVGNKMYVYGGYGGDSRLADLYEFNFGMWARGGRARAALAVLTRGGRRR